MKLTRNQEIAGIILSQMGGRNRLIAMIGAKDFLAINNGLQFKFKMCPKWNCVSITLDAMDTYTMQFYKIRGTKFTKDEAITGLYNDMIKKVFETETKLYISL